MPRRFTLERLFGKCRDRRFAIAKGARCYFADMTADIGIKLNRYSPNLAMAQHDHAVASLSLVLRGTYQEVIRGRVDWLAAGALHFCPAAEPHRQTFGEFGTMKLVISLDNPSLDLSVSILGRARSADRAIDGPYLDWTSDR